MKKIILALALTLTNLALAVSPFELPWMNNTTGGTSYKMSDHANGVFVVEAYFLGCGYCNLNAPAVDKLAAKYAGESRVQVLDVGVDRSNDDYAEWIRRHHPNHPVLKDAQMSLIGELGTSGYPSTYVIDCKGNVVHQTSGTWEAGTAEEIAAAIDSTLSVNCL